MVSDQRAIRERIESQLPKLGRKQRVVAKYILANPTTVLFVSAVEVAKCSDVDPATVVRLAQRLGYSGYPEFRDNLRKEHSVNLAPVEQLLEIGHTGSDNKLPTLKQQVREQTMINVERTFESLDWRAIDLALTYVLSARRVIIGAGISRGLAMHLSRVLQSAQISVQVLEDWYDLLFEAATLSSEDVLFAITAQRYSTVTIKSLQVANEAGANTILLTDATFAPGINTADVALLFSPTAIAEFFSPVCGSAVIDCLAAGLGSRVPEKVKHALELHVELAIDHDLSYW
jgi:DNA-binding MurR/RpiR family transcriptional regulator